MNVRWILEVHPMCVAFVDKRRPLVFPTGKSPEELSLGNVVDTPQHLYGLSIFLVEFRRDKP